MRAIVFTRTCRANCQSMKAEWFTRMIVARYIGDAQRASGETRVAFIVPRYYAPLLTTLLDAHRANSRVPLGA
jgi:hypothetical protein